MSLPYYIVILLMLWHMNCVFLLPALTACLKQTESIVVVCSWLLFWRRSQEAYFSNIDNESNECKKLKLKYELLKCLLARMRIINGHYCQTQSLIYSFINYNLHNQHEDLDSITGNQYIDSPKPCGLTGILQQNVIRSSSLYSTSPLLSNQALGHYYCLL